MPGNRRIKGQVTQKNGIYQIYMKRFFDIVLSVSMIILLLPVIIATGILVKINLGSPVIFTQERPGKDEKIFKMYKFRSMKNSTNREGKLLSDEQRLTRFGSVLRSTSLDELPELWNILKGDMSFVGPRPQLVRDMVFMTPEQRKRHQVRGGLTGLAQIMGRNSISWENKLYYDLKYLDNISFLNDLFIIIKTFKKVAAREDITMNHMATALDFGEYLLKEGKINEDQYQRGLREASEILKKGLN